MDLFVKYKRSGRFKKANIVTAGPMKVNSFVFVSPREKDVERSSDRKSLHLGSLLGG